jgi:hypothetical protein
VERIPGELDQNLTVLATELEGGLESLQKARQHMGPWNVLVARAHGTYRNKPGWSLVVAIVGEPPNAWYFHMLGPDQMVRAHEPEMDSMIESAYWSNE